MFTLYCIRRYGNRFVYLAGLSENLAEPHRIDGMVPRERVLVGRIEGGPCCTLC